MYVRTPIIYAARTCGVSVSVEEGLLIDKPADVEPALRETFKRTKDLVFLDFLTDQAENVYPMIPGGKGITEMILSEDL